MKKIFYPIAFLLSSTTLNIAKCWQKIAAGIFYTLAIQKYSTLWVGENNFYGQRGDGINTNQNQLTTISGLFIPLLQLKSKFTLS